MNRRDDAQPQVMVDLSMNIERLVREHYGYLRRLALSILDDTYEAEDAVQETFIAVNRSLSSFRGEANPRTWLTTIAVNICRGRLRKRKTNQGLQATLQMLHLAQSRPVSLEEAAIQEDAHQSLHNAVAGLDDRHRLPILLRYVHGLSVPEIASVLETNPGTIYSRLHYARHMLMTRLDAQNSDMETSDETQSHPDA